MKTLDDILAQVQAESTVEASLQAFAQNLAEQRDTLKAQVTELQAELAAAGQDTAKIDAIAAALDSNDTVLAATAAQLSAAVTAIPGDDTGTDTGSATTQDAGGGDDTVAAGDTGADTVFGGQGDDTVAAGSGDDTVTASEVTFSPTSISGSLATPASGTFSASDGQTYTYASDDAVPGVTVAADGFYAVAVSQATTGVFNVTPTSPDGVALPAFAVSIDITDA